MAAAKTGIMRKSIAGDTVKNARDFRVLFNLASLLRLSDLSDHPCCLYHQRGGQTKGDSMHYYKFHIGDYRRDTGHLSPIEHYIYRQLIDWYYLEEKPIPTETQTVLRRLSLGNEHEPELLNVLSDFFEKTRNGYKKPRIDEEIKTYKEKCKHNKSVGKQGGRPKKNPDKTQTVSKNNPNHKPLTINHKPISNSNGRMKRPTLSECEAYFLEKGSDRVEAEKFFHHYESNGWKVGKNPMKSWRSSIANWLSRNQSSAYPVKSGSAAQQENNLRVIQNWRPDDAV